jgi:dolichol-phosphate mannosyltransferase
LTLEALVRAALPQLRSAAGPGARVLVVDDASPDGTGPTADCLAAELDEVEVLHRPGQGGHRPRIPGRLRERDALRRGARARDGSDFSHDPADMPRLIAAAGDADLVLGSHYVAGGGVVNWGLSRRLLSRGGSWYARTLLGVPVQDLTGGFKCFRREVLEHLYLADVHADGYGFQIELTYRTLLAGFHVREVPIVFHERRAGASKMSARIALETVWKMPALRVRRGARARARARAGPRAKA